MAYDFRSIVPCHRHMSTNLFAIGTRLSHDKAQVAQEFQDVLAFPYES
jgi:hypothetical protein